MFQSYRLRQCYKYATLITQKDTREFLKQYMVMLEHNLTYSSVSATPVQWRTGQRLPCVHNTPPPLRTHTHSLVSALVVGDSAQAVVCWDVAWFLLLVMGVSL
uniref:Uncharacterized protein n=1 Tax=Photinus pyralis TaxID=7054 RepID=A0A1Y1LMG0_PHOPY